MTKHAYDLKWVGIRKAVISVLQQIEKVFGELKIEWHEFTNCGLRHRLRKVMKYISLDQHTYAPSLRIMAHPDLSGKKAEYAVSPALHSLYCAVLGAVSCVPPGPPNYSCSESGQ